MAIVQRPIMMAVNGSSMEDQSDRFLKNRAESSEPVRLLEGRVALVMGGTRGIGAATAMALRKHGATVAVAGRRPRIDSAGQAEGLAIECDISSEADVDACFAEVTARLGNIDILVNSAGVTADAITARMTLADFRAVLDINLVGTWLACRAALRHMIDEGVTGSIVNVASIAAKAGNYGQGNYAASKAGVVALTKTIAREGARHRIRANVILPGPINTDMTSAVSASALQRILAEVPLGRIGEPEEVANAVVFLASDMSSFITGAAIDVSGGRYM